jgi:hypothetical protein
MLPRTRLSFALSWFLPLAALGVVWERPASAQSADAEPAAKKAGKSGSTKSFVFLPIKGSGQYLAIQSRKSKDGSIRIYHQFVSSSSADLKAELRKEDPAKAKWPYLDATAKSGGKTHTYLFSGNGKYASKDFKAVYLYMGKAGDSYVHLDVKPRRGMEIVLSKDIGKGSKTSAAKKSSDGKPTATKTARTGTKKGKVGKGGKVGDVVDDDDDDDMDDDDDEDEDMDDEDDDDDEDMDDEDDDDDEDMDEDDDDEDMDDEDGDDEEDMDDEDEDMDGEDGDDDDDDPARVSVI